MYRHMVQRPDYWLDLIERSRESPVVAVEAVEYRGTPKHGKTLPVVLLCLGRVDEREYVVKGINTAVHPTGHIHPRSLFNDHVVGRLAQVLGAPVPPVELVHVSNELIQMNPAMMHMLEGPAHGSLLIESVVDSFEVQHLDVSDNMNRFADLAVLFGWLGNDQIDPIQFIYSRVEPYLVYSADQGDSFPSGPDWSPASLNAAPSPDLFKAIERECGFSTEIIRKAVAKLALVTDDVIAGAIGAPPDAWDVSLSDRTELASYLASRRDYLLRTLPADVQEQ
jgi:hypothetical protein